MSNQVIENTNQQGQMSKFKNLFEALLKDHSNNYTYFNNDTANKGDDVDQFNLERDRQMMNRLKGRNSIYLKKVKEALKRIDEGTFGICQDCGAEISEQRLIARPTACLCINCKEAEESQENQTIHRNRYSARFNANDNVLKFKSVSDLGKNFEQSA